MSSFKPHSTNRKDSMAFSYCRCKADAKGRVGWTSSATSLFTNRRIMDPLSIIAGTLQVSTVLVKTASVLENICSKYKTAPLVLSSLQTELSLTLQSLSQLEGTAARSDTLISQHSCSTEITWSLDSALTGCVKLVSYIDHELGKIDVKTPKRDRTFTAIKFTGNFRYFRVERSLQDLSQQLSRQRGAIQLFLQTLQL